MDDLRTLRRDFGKVQAAVKQALDLVATLADKLAGVAAALAAVNAKIQRAGASVTNLAVGTTDVVITWPVSWPDTAYGVYPVIVSGPGPLGTLFATLKAGSKTTDGCVVTVANTGAAPVAAAALDVLGVRT